MTVLCANCHTANRDRAMFCIGCAGKLPAFAATGPSALQAQGASAAAAKAEQRTEAASEGRTAALANAPRGLVLAVLGLGAIVLALTAWISFGPARSPAPGIASAASTVPATASPAVPSTAPTTVPANTTLSPGESMVAAPSASAAPPTAATLPPIFSERIDPGASPVHSAAPPSNAPSQRVASVNANRPAQRSAGDPRAGCEHLFFALAARCEANHCNEAAYARHPRCAIVKEQRLRDEARRNLPN
ncbi:hypothetical protein [Variovorax guangxiensis]|uniref:Zinc ribbon domain-containing protein n=1 Tax=Variovorax guangxiensis TaxID=1775474 RepID=A0A502DXX3_9BURK|nr:hypothetical protein [Variovorax guangxiensis]TPG24853.1 hypothetical protein EAH83_10445 [Variovorax ginsengisoli]TPG29106.1 hypothetical protein EAH82_10105 [Variovorax guangxiensis]